MSIAFTNHSLAPFGENELSSASIQLKAMLLTEIMNSAAKGSGTFLTGGLLGWDLIFAEQVLLVKATEYPNIRLVSVVPYEGLSNDWSEAWRDRYFRVMELSSEVVTISARYTEDCFHAMNRYLVDHADKLLALYADNATSDTGYIIDYAMQNNKEIVVINPLTLERTIIPPRLQTL